MTNLYLALGLLLLLTTCNAHVHGIHLMKPVSCCFNFATGRIEHHKIKIIQETDHDCREKGFIVRSMKWKEICYRHDEKWVQTAFKKQHQRPK